MTRLVLSLAVGLLLVGALLAVRAVQDRSPLEDSIRKLEDHDRFRTSASAGNTIANISVSLRQEGSECRRSGDTATRCTAVLSAAAYAAVTAYTLLDCTAPGVHDGRVAMLDYLRTVRRFVDEGAKGALPSVPKVVTC